MKKFLVLAISIILVFAIVGCSGDDNNTDDMNNATDAPTASATLDDATTLPEMMIPSEMPDIDVNNNNGNNQNQ